MDIIDIFEIGPKAIRLCKKAIHLFLLQFRVFTGKQSKIRKLVNKYQLPSDMKNKDLNSVTTIKTDGTRIKEDINGNIITWKDKPIKRRRRRRY